MNEQEPILLKCLNKEQVVYIFDALSLDCETLHTEYVSMPDSPEKQFLWEELVSLANFLEQHRHLM